MHDTIDPYVVLGIAYDSNDDQIRQAFHEAMHMKNGSSEVVNAYHLIRTQKDRLHYRWGQIQSFISMPVFPKEKEMDVAELIREIAFQSEWELGDDQCLTKE